MVWRLGKTQKGPGMFRPLLAETAESGIVTVLNELGAFYSPSTSNRGFTFERAKNARGSRNPPIWENKVYDKDDDLYAKVNVQHLRSREDASPPPAKTQRLYIIYFNVQNDPSLRLSMQERNNFLQYVQRQNV